MKNGKLEDRDNLTKAGCEDEKWMEVNQCHILWQALALAIFKC